MFSDAALAGKVTSSATSAGMAVEMLDRARYTVVVIDEGVPVADRARIRAAAERTGAAAVLLVVDPARIAEGDVEEPLRRAAEECVGRVTLPRAVSIVRDAMFGRAIERCGGNKTAAGRLLGMSRQRIQLHLGIGARVPTGLPSQPERDDA